MPLIDIEWDYKIDVFSLGCVLGELYLRRPLLELETEQLRRLAMLEAILGPIHPKFVTRVGSQKAGIFLKGTSKIDFPATDKRASKADLQAARRFRVLPHIKVSIDLQGQRYVLIDHKHELKYPPLRDLVLNMTTIDSHERMSLDDALSHRFFHGIHIL